MVLKKLGHILEGLLYDNTIEEEHYRKMRQKSSSNSAIMVGLVAAVGGFLYGYDTGLINDILEMHYVERHIPSSPNKGFSVHERALLTAILLLGTFFGALVAPLISDRYGRKFSIILSSAFLFNVGNTLQVSATDSNLLCGGRAVSGFAVGILSAIVPLYQAEAAPKWVRGSIVFTYQWAITWGLLIALAICQGTRKLTTSGSYRIPIGLQFVWSLSLCTGMLFLPESPRYYVQKNDLQSALRSLSKLRRLPDDDQDLIEELVEIKANYDYEMSFGKTTLLDCFRLGGGRHKQKLRMMTGIGVHAFQQCSGINFIFYYGVNFFSSTGVHNYYLMSFITYLVNVVFTIPGIIFIDVIGRRLLLLYGGVGMAVSNFVIAIVGVTVPHAEPRALVSIVFSCCFIACFASLWGGAVWALALDIFGISIRQKAISLTAATNWLVNFIFAYITPYLIDTGAHTAALGNKIFFIWGGLNTAGVVFVYFVVYETKGLKLEEVDFMYVNCANPRESTHFKSRAINYDNLMLSERAVQSALSPPEWDNQQEKAQGKLLAASDSLSPEGAPREGFWDSQSSSASASGPSAPRESSHIMVAPLSPTLSTTSGSSAALGGSATDYQKYLESLSKNASKGPQAPSLASTSLVRMPGASKRNSLSMVRRTSSQSQTGLSTNTDSFGSTPGLDKLSLSQAGQMKILAAPFFDNPPSDSDSD